MIGDIDLTDIIIMALLIAALIYCFVLSRRMERLRAALEEVGPALEVFSEAVDLSQETVAEMRQASEELSARTGTASRGQETKAAAREGAAPDQKDTLVSGFYDMVNRGMA
ncbi:hypothetical protein ACFSUD_08160 [Sulfitobacter aestuarii]|uniref:Flagellar motor switch protein n=1 Tax=Sulfitobacter aestuarii TaxID=2161676 RepID=A0ABW5U259_9RHOB